MAKENLDNDVEEAVAAYIEWAKGLNITPTDEEIERKRIEIRREMGLEIATLADSGTREIESFDEVADLLRDPSAAPDVLILDDYQKLDDKSVLVNVPFFVNRWWFTDSDQYGIEGHFAVMRCITQRPVRTASGETTKVVVTDGSTGIYKQLREVTQKTGKTAALMVRNGLRVSQYTADTESGPKAAETYYLT